MRRPAGYPDAPSVLSVSQLYLRIWAIFLGGATWAMIIITSNSFRTDSASQMLRMPVWPFQLIFTIGMGLFTLAMLRSVVSYVQGALGRSFDWWTVDVRDSKREETR